jgi:hypothetical protein
MSSQISLVIFEGGLISGHLEEQMHRVRQGIVLDQIVKAGNAGIDHIILCTSFPELGRHAQAYGAHVELDQDLSQRPFHFGQRLFDVVHRHRLKKVLYMGGAAAPLVSSQELRYIRDILDQNEGVVTANNYYSADIVGFTPGTALNQITLPPIDNTLASALTHEGGLRWIPLQRTLGLNFDIDTPTDLLILSVHPDMGHHTKQAVKDLDLDFSRYNAIKELANNPNGEMVLFGRVGSNLFQYLDAQTRCRIRLFSEERGMKALGRDERGEVVSLMGKLVESIGFTAFFEFLSEICDGAVLDTRVLFEHFHWKLSQSDRFASDLGEVDLITHPGLEEFTKAAINAPIPVLLGGHSLVTGGLWALIDAGARGGEYRS